MRMATKLLASHRADVGVRSLLVNETTEITYMMKHADLVLCDCSSEEVLVACRQTTDCFVPLVFAVDHQQH